MSRILNELRRLASLVSLPVFLQGAALPIVNPSFEDLTGANPAHFETTGTLRDDHYSIAPGYPVEATGFSTANPIPGWTTTSSAGTYNPPARLVPLEAPHGNNVAWVNVTGVIRQTLAINFQANTTYELTVEVGALQGFGFPGYEVGLFGANNVVALDRGSSSLAGPGRFGTTRVSVWVGEDSPAVGAPIEIRLGIPGNGDGQADFDWVRLDAVTVPEPSMFVLLTCGGLAVAMLIVRRGHAR